METIKKKKLKVYLEVLCSLQGKFLLKQGDSIHKINQDKGNSTGRKEKKKILFF